MKINSPLPSSLPKECQKASRVFRSFVDGSNNGLDGVIPRSVLENARGFAIFTVFKAGFLFSARAGSGIVIARLQDGSWSAPSAIGTAGLGVGGQAGAEMTDFLVVLNSRSAVASFMSAGNLTLGGNLSIAIGPLGRNGEASGALNTKGKVAAMYSYSKTRGLFGGISLEGSAIVERSDANAQAYRSDVTVKMLLSGAIPPPEWAQVLIRTLEQCTGSIERRGWVNERYNSYDDGYMFDSVSSPRDENGTSRRSSTSTNRPANGRRGSNYGLDDDELPPGQGDLTNGPTSSYGRNDRHGWASSPAYRKNTNTTRNRFDRDEPTTDFFDTKFESDFVTDEDLRRHPPLSATSARSSEYPFGNVSSGSSSNHRRAASAYTSRANDNPFEDDYGYQPRQSQPRTTTRTRGSKSYDFDHDRDDVDNDRDVFGAPIPNAARSIRGSTPPPKLEPKMELSRPLRPSDGIARAIALFDFNAVQSGDLSFKKGQVITVTEMSDNSDTWWHGKLEGRNGIFPANFVEVV